MNRELFEAAQHQHQVLLLGPPTLQGPDGKWPLASVKGQALLWYLAAHPGRMFARMELADLLWPDGDAGGRLRTTLWRMRSTMPIWPFRAEGDRLGWERESGVLVDTALFDQLTASNDIDAWVTAAALWRGSFLQGFHLPERDDYEQWLSEHRHYWSRKLMDTLGRITDRYMATRAWERVKTYAGQAMHFDPLNERFCGYLMTADYHLGERSAALSRYNILRHRLQIELGVAPDVATTSLRDLIAAEVLPRLPEGVDEGPGSKHLAHGAAPLPETLPLAGRRDELAACMAALTGAQSGAVRVVLLHGEAGIGKSRLAEEVVSHLQLQGAQPAYGTVLIGNCYETETASPLGPFLAALAEHLPGVKLTEQQPSIPKAITQLLAELPGPVLMVLEDIHWADWESLQLMAYLARQPVARGITLLVTCRAEEVPDQAKRLLLQLQREQRLAWLEMDALTAVAIEDLITSGVGRQDAGLSQWVYSESRGNPLFALEILRSLPEGGPLVVGKPVGLVPVPIPQGVRLVIHGKILRLDQPARHLLRTASLFPAGVSFDILRDVADMQQDAALAALDNLLHGRLLGELKDVDGFAPRVTFRHDLVRRMVYDDASQTTRQALHQRAFRYFEAAAQEFHAAPPADAEPPLTSLRSFWSVIEHLLYNAMAGGLWEQGLTWSLQAAAGARARSFHATATRFLEHALACLQQLPVTPQRQALRFDLNLQLANSSVYIQPDQMPALQAAAATVAAATGDDVRLALVKVSQSVHLCVMGRYREGQALLEPVLRLARATGNEVLLGSCLRMLATHLAARGRFKPAKAYLAESAPLEDRTGDHVEATMGRLNTALIQAMEGDFVAADALLQPLLAAVRTAQDPVAEAYVLAYTTHVESVRGNWQAVTSAALGAITLARETGHLFQEYLAKLYIGPALAEQGDLVGAIRAQKEVLNLARQFPTAMFLGQAYAWLGKLQLVAGDLGSADSAVRSGLKIATEQDCAYDIACCKQVMGEFAAAQGRSQVAAAMLSDALQRFIALGARPAMARCYAALALVGSSSERAAHRRSAVSLFRRMGMKWDLAHLPPVTLV